MIASDAGKIIVGDILEIELSLPGEPMIHPLARVVRVVPVGRDPHGPCGIGLCYVRIRPSEQDQINRYVFRRQSELRDARRKLARLRLDNPFRIEYRLRCSTEYNRAAVISNKLLERPRYRL